MDIQDLEKAVQEKLVSKQKHPNADLYIYNYTQICQYERIWNEVTLNTRGLILDGQGNTVARGFKKFFNIEEHKPEEIPSESFEVYEKMDGSLAILYWLNDKPYIATRGSFESEQAIHATEVLHTKYSHIFDKLNKNYTYLFEIIYKANRIVVDYGDLDDIILLAIIDNKTGLDMPIEDIGFHIVKRYDGINNIEELKALDEENKEGFVIKFKSGFRVKMKFQDYVRLHRIITGVSNIAIWEYMKDGKDFQELLDKVPDEFYNWVKSTKFKITQDYITIANRCRLDFQNIPEGDRREKALYIQKQKYPSILFSMLDGKEYGQSIYKLIRPKFSKPFKQDELC